MPNDASASAVDQTQLDGLTKRLERKTKEVEIIQQVSSQINTTLDLEKIAKTMSDQPTSRNRRAKEWIDSKLYRQQRTQANQKQKSRD